MASWDAKGQEHTDTLEREYDMVILKDRLHWEKVLLQKYQQHLTDLTKGKLARGGKELLDRYEINYLLNAA